MKCKIRIIIVMAIMNTSIHANFADFISQFFQNLGIGNGTQTRTHSVASDFGAGVLSPATSPCAQRPISFDPNPELEADYAAEGFDVINTFRLETGVIEQNPDTQFTHTLSMDAIRLEGAGFNQEQVMERIQKAADVLKQCGVALTDYNLTSVHPLQDNQGRDIVTMQMSNSDPNVLAYARNIPASANRPAMFFVTDTGEQDGFALWGSGPQANTSFVSDNILREAVVEDLGRGRRRMTPGHSSVETDFSVVAHELVHILCRCGHVPGDEPNLMSESPDPNSRRSILTDDQCRSIRNSPLLEEIDQPVPTS